jgi:hypothetical protein
MYVQNRNKSFYEKVKIYYRLTEGLHRFRIKNALFHFFTFLHIYFI